MKWKMSLKTGEEFYFTSLDELVQVIVGGKISNAEISVIDGAQGNAKPDAGINVNKIKLQRTKFTEKRFFDFKLEKRRTKWELIKMLQEEFDKFPDEIEFSSFSAVGLGIGRSRYY